MNYSTSPQTATLTEENLKKYAKNDEMAMNVGFMSFLFFVVNIY